MKVYKVTFVHTDTVKDAFDRYYQSIHSAKEACEKVFRSFGLGVSFRNDTFITFVEPVKTGEPYLSFRDLHKEYGMEFAPFLIQRIDVEK